jgi:hypothetical protein
VSEVELSEVELSESATHRRSRATVALRAIMIGAVVLSVFHYTDNYVRFDRYALSADGLVTEPLAIPLSWLLFTVVGAAGYALYHRERWWPAVVCLVVYSVSGLVSPLHYTEGPLSAFDAVQHVLIVTDLLAGLSVLGYAVWLMIRRAVPGTS